MLCVSKTAQPHKYEERRQVENNFIYTGVLCLKHRCGQTKWPFFIQGPKWTFWVTSKVVEKNTSQNNKFLFFVTYMFFSVCVCVRLGQTPTKPEGFAVIKQVCVTEIEPVTLKLWFSWWLNAGSDIKHSSQGESALLVFISGKDDKLGAVRGICCVLRAEGNGAEGSSQVNLFHLEHAEKPEAMFYQGEERTLRKQRGRESVFIN